MSSKIQALETIAGRLIDRANDWLDATNMEDISLRIPDKRVRETIALAGKLHIEAARLRLDERRLEIFAKGRGHVQLTDAEYQDGMARLAKEAMREMTTADLAAEVKRRMRVES